MKKLLISLAATLALNIVVPYAAWADYIITSGKKGSGYVLYTVYDDKWKQKSWHLYTEVTHEWVASGNPNQEDGGKGIGDPKSGIKDAMALLLQNGGTVNTQVDFWTTPIGEYLGNTGKGQGNYNQTSQPGPGDDGSGGPSFGGGGPNNSLEELEKMNTPKPGGKTPFQPNSGGAKDFVHKNKGKKGGDDSGDGSNDPTNGKGLFGGLPGPPELVNPNPVLQKRVARMHTGVARMRFPSVKTYKRTARMHTSVVKMRFPSVKAHKRTARMHTSVVKMRFPSVKAHKRTTRMRTSVVRRTAPTVRRLGILR